MSETKNAGIKWFVCDSGHVHMTFTDAKGNDLMSISIDIEDWLDLVDEIDEEVEVNLSMVESKAAVKH